MNHLVSIIGSFIYTLVSLIGSFIYTLMSIIGSFMNHLVSIIRSFMNHLVRRLEGELDSGLSGGHPRGLIWIRCIAER